MTTMEEVAGWLRELAKWYWTIAHMSGMPCTNELNLKRAKLWEDRASEVDAMGWRPIEEAPIGKKMFVVISVTDQYISDPWCVWQVEKGIFSRWPHKFKPTHYMLLPQPPVKK